MNFFNELSNNSKGIVYAILTCFFVSIMIAIARHLSSDFHVFFIVMMRNLFAFLMFVPLMIKTRNALFKTDKFHLHFWRSVNGLAGMLLWFYVITLAPLPEAVSFTFVVPIITTLAAMFFLKEKVSKNIWISLAIGMVGILIIIRPGFKEFNIAYVLAFITTILWSITNILIKVMTKTEKPQTIVAYMSFIILILSLPFGLMHMEALTLNDVFWLVLLGICSNLSHISMSNSYLHADLSVVQPFDFVRLIFISIIAYFAFGEVLDVYTLIGSIIIMTGVIFVAPKRNKPYTELIDIKNQI